eukprot:TRINITY_DN8565_c0_g1_i1.p1 TRINITY_DN8565_c0_g1~~TRINITY_DN8565_c0_g1_i1.p1  ORF type:complete len:276 (-),score=63.82 TRINITY_DN8565_c0_g1_i1:30-857(-)
MARNEEKSQSMLNRFLQMKSEERKKPRERRPFLASECHNLIDAEKWRTDILREIGKKVSDVQNEGLGEHRIRDLNDDINKLLREKAHWERRIIELGGQNYLSQAPKVFDDEGQAVEGSTYKYFGAAKKLPGVKDLFYQDVPQASKRSRSDMYRGVDADYYGMRDEDDGLLLKLEEASTKEALRLAEEGWNLHKKQKVEAIIQHKMKNYEAEEGDQEEKSNSSSTFFPLSVPTKDDMEKALLQKRKQDVIRRYISDPLLSSLAEQEAQIKVVLGKS